MKYTIRMETGYINISPYAFHKWAMHWYKCKQDFKPPDRFSPVPYFLLCRAIELELKSRHLCTMGQEAVKKQFWHHLEKSYEALNGTEQVLDDGELSVLKSADKIYNDKRFEYFLPIDAAEGYSDFPDLNALDAVARKLIFREK